MNLSKFIRKSPVFSLVPPPYDQLNLVMGLNRIQHMNQGYTEFRRLLWFIFFRSQRVWSTHDKNGELSRQGERLKNKLEYSTQFPLYVHGLPFELLKWYRPKSKCKERIQISTHSQSLIPYLALSMVGAINTIFLFFYNSSSFPLTLFIVFRIFLKERRTRRYFINSFLCVL